MGHASNCSESEAFLKKKMVGMSLDSFHVYGIYMEISFLNRDKSVWISGLGIFRVLSDTNSSDSPCEDRTDRKSEGVGTFLPNLHKLIGREVTNVVIDETDRLEVHFGDAMLTVEDGGSGFEEIWSVTPTTPNPTATHDWSVTLTDEGLVFNTV